jgi:hypothetical protein
MTAGNRIYKRMGQGFADHHKLAHSHYLRQQGHGRPQQHR